MARYLKTALLLAKIQLIRNLRDPITTIVLFGIPVLLVLVFGAIAGGNSNISVRVAVINDSQQQFAKDFEKSLTGIKAFKVSDKQLDLEKAKEEMRSDGVDSVIVLPDNFGEQRDGQPSGKLQVYYDQSDTQTADIVASIVGSVVDDINRRLVGEQLQPVSVERQAINVNEAKGFDNIFAMFTGMAIMMVGIFGVASLFPADKKSGVLRRLRATPLRSGQVILGTMLAYVVIGLIGVALLTTIAITVYDLQMRGDWLTYGAFTLAALTMMLGFGLAIGGIAKNSTQSDVLGQIIFLASLAVSGVWFPRSLMPDFLQSITSFMPLAPIIDGIRNITTEGANLLALGPELAVIAAWAVIVYIVGIRTFRWS